MKHQRTNYTCKTCKKQFLATVGAINRKDFTSHCSPRCRWNDPELKDKTRIPGSWHKERTITCKGCLKEVTARLPADTKFCSKKCYLAFTSRIHKVKRVIVCAYCKKDSHKEQALSQLKRYKNLFCSKECANKFQAEDESSLIRVRKSRQLQNKRKGPNGLELLGRELLESLGLKLDVDFEEQVLLNKRFIVDVYLKENKIVIEWDGDYWHGHKRYILLDTTQQKVKKKDKAENAYLKKCGFTVIRFWESDIKTNPTAVKNKLKKVLKL